MYAEPFHVSKVTSPGPQDMYVYAETAAKKDKKAEVLFNVENLVVLTKTDLEVLIQTYAKTIKSEITFSIVNTKYPAVRQQIEAINEKIRQHKKTHHPTITMYNTLEEYVEEKGYKPTQPLMDLNLDPEIEKLLR